MKRSQRGAARVSVTWLIVFLVLFIVGCLMAWLGYEDATKAEKARVDAVQARDAANARDQESTDAMIKVSSLVGWSPAELATPRTNVEQAALYWNDWKQTWPDMGADIKTIEASLPKAKEAYLTLQRQVATLNDQIKTLTANAEASERASSDALRAKDNEISTLRKQVGDDAATASARQSELESRIATITTQRNELDAQTRELRNQLDAEKRKLEDEKIAQETRLKSMGKSLAFLKEPESKDGKVLSVSKDLALGWIDIGANQRLARGTRFRVVSGKIGAQKLKGWAEVTEVKPTMAEVSFSEIVDRFDPIVEGDVIFNPIYDPKGERTAVLCGRFSGQFNEAELKALLKNMAITVQAGLSHDTDYLIVGAELYVDENGEPLENPLPPSDLPVYKDAEAQGTQIVSIKDLRNYFKF
ncbi:MAG: hypothetical protein IT454_06390 [Planctomycetes bacterium]|nr:hypothetical protein [Planctomycetota bacterium]